ncbi:MAG: glutaredoxin [Candidatus Melainabacteria bacterium HGW-Melainabacteria-1]|nr:MAG: glutaredoxin [Candidatus Melainabacteria bacterium HGW-Melainabacteria-1]
MNGFTLLEKLWERLQPQAKANRFDGFDLEHPPKELILYKFDGCIFCQRVMLFIGQHKLPVVYRDVRENAAYQRELLAHTGRTQVPCLLIDGKPMLESADIVAYLKQVFLKSNA